MVNNELTKLIDKMNSEATRLKVLEASFKKKKEDVELIYGKIQDIVAGPVSVTRKSENKETGTVNVLVSGVMVKHCVEKKVIWDQEKLAGIEKDIIDSGDKPEGYIEKKTIYGVNETLYSAFAPEIKAVFDVARTVNHGKPKMTFTVERG